ncbi:sulfotransferase family protein [Nafulsella turpanensis]|uniref:sulfotransferase family 2 domain-containing protein n=1 Tax=Nafulsella turpanensis TaxID=1265690 RepID=UPI00034B16FA|nr:sulfotransferase family 2 domain-containing protein [Nafulsella turpanensis]
MIISHRHRFIFIKTQKTAGSSLEIALSRICGPEDVITPLTHEEEEVRKALGYRGCQNYIIPFRQYKRLDWAKLAYFRKRVQFIEHASAAQIQWYIDPDVWSSYFKFCFERNPWDKTVSYYYWHEGDKTHGSIRNFLETGEAGEMLGFNLYSRGGMPVVDKVFLYEDMPEALQELSGRFNLKEPLTLPDFKAKGQVRKDRRHYREILSLEEQELIAKIFAREIRYFSYSF